MRRLPVLIGLSGHFAGEIKPLTYGRTYIVGRSRTADISLRRTRKYRAQTDAERDSDEVAQTISGKHFQVTPNNPQSIVIRNMSVNGTQVDGRAIDALVLDDILERPHTITFGMDGVFRLELRDVEEE